ncbi:MULTISPECIES: hypothetical protein [unclassified Microbulbifer]|uniref:hypothetical protein n=1 Tax=unclassified Microbulbifer TaxID=2619833 RepID=UPI0027E3C54F|nr:MULTISPECIES: hypothetical protein [unclassified Microbulbifer]
MRSLLFIPWLLLAGTAGADSLADQMQRCAGMQNDSERLACYDALGSSLEQRAEQSFGREQQQIAEEAPDSINATIAEIRDAAYGKLQITLTNGQVWRQNDSTRVNWKSGDMVIIERALFGSFFMKQADGGRSMRVKRVK